MQNLKAMLDLVQIAGATRLFQTPSFGTVATLSDSTPQPIRFNRPGFAVSLVGSIQSGAVADYGGTTLRVQLGGTEDLFIDGQGGPAFVPFLTLFGGVDTKQPVLRRVEAGTLWVFTCHNNTAGGVIPSAAVNFLDDEDIKAIVGKIPR